MALFVDDGDHSGGVAVLLGVALRAVGGVWCLWGLVGSFGRVLKSAAMVRQVGLYFARCLLTIYDFC